MSKHGTASMQKHITLTIHQKLEIIRRPASGKSQKGLWLHTTLDHHL